MSHAHTPGPWVVTEDMGSNIIRGTEEERAVEGLAGMTYKWRDYVASTWGGPHEANARLIAAAPDLLSVLADLLEAADSMRDTFGCTQGRHPEEDDTYIHEKWAEDFLQERAEAARAAIAKATGGTQ